MKSFVLGMFMFAQSPEHIHIIFIQNRYGRYVYYHTRYINMTILLVLY